MAKQIREFNPLQPDFLDQKIRSRMVNNINGLNIHILEAGFEIKENPLILLLHGFPEIAFSWRKIIPALASEGYHVVAPDMRGYGKSTGWDRQYRECPAEFKMLNLVRDCLDLVRALGHTKVQAIIGHDFGSPVSGWCSLIRPDIFESVILMSAPFTGFREGGSNSESIHRELMTLSPARKHYQWYYSSATANRDLMNCPQGLQKFFRAYYHMKSGDWEKNQPFPLQKWSAEELEKLPYYYVMENSKDMAQTVSQELPSASEIKKCKWLTDADLSIYVNEYENTGFQGGLNGYWNITNDLFASELSLFRNCHINVPSMFVAGDKDWGIHQVPGALTKMKDEVCKDFKGIQLVKNAGHWVQQEKPDEVIKLIKNFLTKH